MQPTLIRPRWRRTPPGKKKPNGPLTPAERNRLLRDWLAAYPKPVMFIQARFPGLLRKAVFHGHTHDDVNAACLLGGVEAARLYDPRRGVPFRLFVPFYLRKSVQELYRRSAIDHKNRAERLVTSIDQSLGDDDGDSVAALVPDGKAVDSPVSDCSVVAAMVAEVLRTSLPDVRSRRIAELRWGLDGGGVRTLSQVGELVGVSRERVRQIEVRILKKCRPHLEPIYRELAG